jgi:hypothetical protein
MGFGDSLNAQKAPAPAPKALSGPGSKRPGTALLQLLGPAMAVPKHPDPTLALTNGPLIAMPKPTKPKFPDTTEALTNGPPLAMPKPTTPKLLYPTRALTRAYTV